MRGQSRLLSGRRLAAPNARSFGPPQHIRALVQVGCPASFSNKTFTERQQPTNTNPNGTRYAAPRDLRAGAVYFSALAHVFKRPLVFGTLPATTGSQLLPCPPKHNNVPVLIRKRYSTHLHRIIVVPAPASLASRGFVCRARCWIAPRFSRGPQIPLFPVGSVLWRFFSRCAALNLSACARAGCRCPSQNLW